ncbi:MAG: nuclear transport factor 2 family protein [Deltaproteobacteria bacterium]
MHAYSREELEEMVERFVQGNLEAGRTGDWSRMPDFYTEDALYSWGNGPKYEFVARGRKEIAEIAYGTEMEGLETWHYPYVRTLIDEKKGEFMGFWRQVAPIQGPDGSAYEIGGTGGSWFRYAGNFQWCWQRDFFDSACSGATFQQMWNDGVLTETMQARLRKGSRMPGWVKANTFDWYATVAEREDES